MGVEVFTAFANHQFQRLLHGPGVLVRPRMGENVEYIGDVMVFVKGPYADKTAAFAASDGVRDVVAKRYPHHKLVKKDV